MHLELAEKIVKGLSNNVCRPEIQDKLLAATLLSSGFVLTVKFNEATQCLEVAVGVLE